MTNKPLLYIHQNKEAEIQVEAPSSVYTKRATVISGEQKKNQTNKSELKNKEKQEQSTHQNVELIENTWNEKKFKDMTVAERLYYLHSFSSFFKPKVEVEVEEVMYVGTIKKIENELVTFTLETSPYMKELHIDEITFVAIRSL